LIHGDYAIDDYHENLKAMNISKRKFLISKPYNLNAEIDKQTNRIVCWKDLLWIMAIDNENLMEELSMMEIEQTKEIVPDTNILKSMSKLMKMIGLKD